MKILFLTDNFPPESNAPATRTYEHCLEWRKQGAEVTVITCAPNFPQGKIYSGYKNKWRQEEIMDGIRVIRVWTYITPNRGIFRRILDYLSFCFSAFFASLSIKTDVIVATSPQLFTAFAGYLASLFKRKKWVMEVRDLWPESIKAVGAMKESRVLKMLDRLVIFLYRKANHIVVVTDAFKNRMIACGVDPNKVSIVKNGVNLDQYFPREKNQDLLKKLKLENKFILGYIGTLGMAHKLDFIIDAAKKIKNKNIHILIIGDGAMKTRLAKQIDRVGVKNVTLLDPIKKSEVPDYISIIDAAVINLRKKDTFKKVIPSKIFENAAMEKPILLGVDGEAKELINQYGAGIFYAPENEKEFLASVETIHSDVNLRENLVRGCRRLAEDFQRERLAQQMLTTVIGLNKNETKSSRVILPAITKDNSEGE